MKKIFLLIPLVFFLITVSCDKDDEKVETENEIILNGRIVFSVNNQVPNNLKVLSLDGITEIESNTILDLPTSENGLEFLLNGNDEIVFLRKNYSTIDDNTFSSKSTILFLSTFNAKFYSLSNENKNTIINQILEHPNYTSAKNLLDNASVIDITSEEFKQDIALIVNEIFSEENINDLPSNPPSDAPLVEVNYSNNSNLVSISNNTSNHIGYSIRKGGVQTSFGLIDGNENFNYSLNTENTNYDFKMMSGADISGVFSNNQLEEIEAFNADFNDFLFEAITILIELAIPSLEDACLETIFSTLTDGINFAENYGNNNNANDAFLEAFSDITSSLPSIVEGGFECIEVNGGILGEILSVFNVINDIFSISSFLNDTAQTITEYYAYENLSEKCFYFDGVGVIECGDITISPVYNPNPINNSTNNPLTGQLTFTPGLNTPNNAIYRIYFGDTNNPTDFEDTTSPNNTYSGTQEGITYYWRVETLSNEYSILANSPIWDFVTINSSNNTIPTATTNSITEVTEITATSGGNVTDDGGNNVTTRGICWSTDPNPTTANSTTNDGTGIGEYVSSLTGLIENTTYYVRAYATNSEGTGYGNQEVFTTLTSSGDIYIGDVTLTTQAEVDAFGANNYTGITGLLMIGTYDGQPIVSDIHNLSPLSSLNNVGIFNIFNNIELLTLQGLHNISTIDTNLDIYKNGITSLNGLNSLTNIYSIGIRDNTFLLSLDGLNSGLTNVGFLSINNNPNLANLEGLSGISSVYRGNQSQSNQSNFYIKNNNSLINLTGLENLQEVGWALRIEDNSSLESLDGIENINLVGNNLEITENTVLFDFCSLQNYLASTDLIPYIANNQYNPTKQDIIDGNCSQ